MQDVQYALDWATIFVGFWAVIAWVNALIDPEDARRGVIAIIFSLLTGALALFQALLAHQGIFQ